MEMNKIIVACIILLTGSIVVLQGCEYIKNQDCDSEVNFMNQYEDWTEAYEETTSGI